MLGHALIISGSPSDVRSTPNSGRKRTFPEVADGPTTDLGGHPLDHLVYAQHEWLGDSQIESSCRREIEDEFEPRRLFDG